MFKEKVIEDLKKAIERLHQESTEKTNMIEKMSELILKLQKEKESHYDVTMDILNFLNNIKVYKKNGINYLIYMEDLK